MIEFTKEELSCIEFCLEQQIEMCEQAISYDKDLVKQGLIGVAKSVLKTANESKENCQKLMTKICKHQSK